MSRVFCASVYMCEGVNILCVCYNTCVGVNDVGMHLILIQSSSQLINSSDNLTGDVNFGIQKEN